MFLSIFTVSDDFYSNVFNNWKILLQNKLNYQAYISLVEQIKNVSSTSDVNLSVVYYGKTIDIVNFDSFSTFRNAFHNFIRGSVFIFLVFYNYNQVYKLIRGSNYIQSGNK